MNLRDHVADLKALFVALLVFWAVAMAVISCGDNDLVFPGDAPRFPTPEFTSTPEDEDDGF
jgi:hypothetical protein